MQNKKYVFITGGVCSSLGKGIAASAIAALMEACGYRTSMLKMDPYINVDAGTMDPWQHGETYVTEDGMEADLDLGHYERFTQRRTTKANTVTAGQVYQAVIARERQGEYAGKCVQVIPHITNEIQARMAAVATPATDIVIVEIGGTIGDIEGIPFVEAVRQFSMVAGKENVCFVHLTLVPRLPGSEEIKTKPTQHGVQMLRALGIQPDVLLCRTEGAIPKESKQKIALFTQVAESAVMEAANFVHTIYELPLTYDAQGLSATILAQLSLPAASKDLSLWQGLYEAALARQGRLRVGVAGKYTHLQDTYKSIYEALAHAGLHHRKHVDIEAIDSETVTPENVAAKVQGLDAILIPGGFGARGIAGKIAVARYAREHKIPCLGICLGMQVMVIEYARNVAGLAGAHSTEFDPHTPHPVIALLETQKQVHSKGGTMRLGAEDVRVLPDTLLAQAYKATTVRERHRHRYEVNNAYLEALIEKKLILAALHKELPLVEGVIWPDHPWGVGVQYHPEFESTPFKPHPVFIAFLQAAINRRA